MIESVLPKVLLYWMQPEKLQIFKNMRTLGKKTKTLNDPTMDNKFDTMKKEKQNSNL